MPLLVYVSLTKLALINPAKRRRGGAKRTALCMAELPFAIYNPYGGTLSKIRSYFEERERDLRALRSVFARALRAENRLAREFVENSRGFSPTFSNHFAARREINARVTSATGHHRFTIVRRRIAILDIKEELKNETIRFPLKRGFQFQFHFDNIRRICNTFHR